MRQLFVEYNQSELLQPAVGEISWSKHLIILAKCKDEHQRFFYIKMTAQHRWSKTALSNAIAGRLWENTLLHQHNFEETLPVTQAEDAASVIRDEYTFGFLHLSEPYTEAQLEQALLSNTFSEDLPKELSAFFPTSEELAERVESLTKNLKSKNRR
jgi:predicted nuclease of restriction endonuclease-like (RecB) superfamily